MTSITRIHTDTDRKVQSQVLLPQSFRCVQQILLLASTRMSCGQDVEHRTSNHRVDRQTDHESAAANGRRATSRLQVLCPASTNLGPGSRHSAADCTVCGQERKVFHHDPLSARIKKLPIRLFEIEPQPVSLFQRARAAVLADSGAAAFSERVPGSIEKGNYGTLPSSGKLHKGSGFGQDQAEGG